MDTVIMTTHDGLENEIRVYCWNRLQRQVGDNDLQLIRMGQRGCRSSLAIMTKMHAALLQASGDHCYIVEHDCLYPDDYFTAEPCDLSYSANAWFLNADGFVRRQHAPLSSLFGNREKLMRGVESLLGEHFRRGKVRRMEFGLGDPSTKMRDCGTPFIDIRHGKNHTGKREGVTFDEVEGWGNYAELWKELGRA